MLRVIGEIEKSILGRRKNKERGWMPLNRMIDVKKNW